MQETPSQLSSFLVSYKNCASAIVEEVTGIWPDFLITILCDEWRKCKRAMESSSPRKDSNCMLLPPQKLYSEDDIPEGSSFAAGQRMDELVKDYSQFWFLMDCVPLDGEELFIVFFSNLVFALLHQIRIFTLGRALPEQPPIYPPGDLPANCHAQASGLDVSGPKPGTEVSLVNVVPGRIAFERGKECHFCFLAISVGTSGWLVLAEELPLKKTYGVVRVAAPLAGCNPRIDDKHSRWLHLRIRPSSLPFLDPAKFNDFGKMKTKALVDGRWTLAFRDEESCKSTLSMIVEENNFLSDEVHKRLKPLLNLETAIDLSSSSVCVPEGSSSSHRTRPNSL